MYHAVMVGKYVKHVVREWHPSATGPLPPTMTDSLLALGWEVLYKRHHHFCPCQEQERPQGRGACSTFPHEAGASTEKSQLEASIALCFEWVG